MTMTTLSNDAATASRPNVFLRSAPRGTGDEFNTLFTAEAIEFLVDLVTHFDRKVDQLYYARSIRKYELKQNPKIPKFFKSYVTKSKWEIAPVGKRAEKRHVDLGDVSPSNLDHFSTALRCKVDGVQVDFDDGHCPTWKNQIIGLYNVYKAVRSELPNVPAISQAPILMLRPRAWNMIEHNMSINGKEVPGPLLDFGLLAFHNAKILFECESGPYFYLSKLEGASEAKLWNDIFVWTQFRLRIPHGTIKACVLIENILSSFEMEDMLFSLKDHSLGLNCGIWDYAASIINKFGNEKSFVLPDRNKYVNMNRHFLKRYMELVVQICHKRKAHATGGMAALLLPEDKNSKKSNTVVSKVLEGKLAEIKMGVDGFIIYDVGLVPHVNDLWKYHGGPDPNQISYPGVRTEVSVADLLKLPTGGITVDGVRHNISVAILFIFHWFQGMGHFSYKGAVEDSATAEISRSQIWQWIRHGATFEDSGQMLTRELVLRYSSEILDDLIAQYGVNFETKLQLYTARDLFMDIVNHREFPEFITTYLNDTHVFRRLSANL
ncbi:malate synthase-like [Athalia rosae]|uniref:malate synthase-like n=1 Tax=Athalia rosae TaxID=37344 RepID=UPI0020340641|nr:malate synthase-like [Athalia rosae]